MNMEFKILEPDKLILRRGPILVVSSKEGAERPNASIFNLAVLRSKFERHIPEEYPFEPNWLTVLVSDVCVSLDGPL